MIHYSPEQFKVSCPALVMQEERVGVLVATSGAFDLLHRGHLKLFRYCRKLGDTVVVLLNTNHSIQKYKSEHRPVKDWNTRAELLDAMGNVDHVVGLHEADPIYAIGAIRPDVWVKGDRPIEEIVEKDALFGLGCDIIVLWNCEAGSSTDLIEKAAQIYAAEQNPIES